MKNRLISGLSLRKAISVIVPLLRVYSPICNMMASFILLRIFLWENQWKIRISILIIIFKHHSILLKKWYRENKIILFFLQLQESMEIQYKFQYQKIIQRI